MSDIPKKDSKVPVGKFSECDKLNTAKLNNWAKGIDMETFWGYVLLTKVKISTTEKKVGRGPFLNDNYMDKIDISNVLD